MSIFVCWWVFFLSWQSIFFLTFTIRFNFTGGRRRHGEEPAEFEGKWGAGPTGFLPRRRWPPVKLKPMTKAKKNTQSRKKNTHQQTKILIQRKHVYAYDMPFLCPPNLCAILINRGITIIIPQYMNLFLQENSFSVCALTLHIAGIYFYN